MNCRCAALLPALLSALPAAGFSSDRSPEAGPGGWVARVSHSLAGYDETRRLTEFKISSYLASEGPYGQVKRQGYCFD